MTTLVVGRGLLGGHVVRELVKRGRRVSTVDVPWGQPQDSLTALLTAVERTAREHRSWRLAWCAGAGVVASRALDLRVEADVFDEFVARASAVPDAFFLASSAGGVYGGAPGRPPFTEASRTGSIGAYGATKLATEASATALAARGCRVVVARIANLYGPGQNLAKPQGLISQLCLAQVTRRPLGIYVSMDTLRDYLFAADAADMVCESLDRVAGEPEGTVVTKILASGHSASVGAIIAEVGRLSRHRPRISTRAGSGGVRDLRMRSIVWTEIDSFARTPLAVGLHATSEDIARRMRAGVLQQALR